MKQKHFKRIAALLLVAVMAVSAFAGCGFVNTSKETKTEAKATGDLYFTNQEVRESPEWVTKLDA